MIQLTKRLAMTADKHCYTVGEPWKRGERPLEIRNPKYYTTAMQAVQGALNTAMRQAVEDCEVTTLREFIRKQEQLLAELETLIASLEGGNARQNVVEVPEAAGAGKDTPQHSGGGKGAWTP